MDKELTISEIKNTIDYTYDELNDIDSKIIYNTKLSWLNDFFILVNFYMNYTSSETISSTNLSNLWIFYIEGLRIRRFFEQFNKEIINELLQIKNPISDLLVNIENESIENILNVGPIIYQISHYLSIIKLKISYAVEKYSKIFNSLEPIDWFKNNNHSFYFDFDVSILKKIELLNLKILKTEDINNDPFLRR